VRRASRPRRRHARAVTRLKSTVVDRILHVLIGDVHGALDAVVKTSALFVTAAILFRFTERRTLAEFAPFDWIAAVAAGAIVGRAATATDTSWLTATAALVCLLVTHAALTRLRFVPGVQRIIDPPLRVLIRDGRVDRRSLRRCGLTPADLEAVLRQHGHHDAERIHLAIFESKGAISVLPYEAPRPQHPIAGKHSPDQLAP
jgi:uncharacterized membrane protein YcaP (DUF421 family)